MVAFTTSSFPSLSMAKVAQTLVHNEINIELDNYGYEVPVTPSESPEAYLYINSAANAGIAARILSMMPMETYTYPDSSQSGGNRRTMLDREYRKLLDLIKSRRLRAKRSRSRISQFTAGSEFSEEGYKKKPLFTSGQFDYPGSRNLVDDYGAGEYA